MGYCIMGFVFKVLFVEFLQLSQIVVTDLHFIYIMKYFKQITDDVCGIDYETVH